jgi:hypothetical protein
MPKLHKMSIRRHKVISHTFLVHSLFLLVVPFLNKAANALYRKFETNYPEMKLCGLVPNFYIHVSACERFTYSQIVPQTQYSRIGGRSWEYINCSQIHEYRNWERGRAVSFPGIFVSNFRCRELGKHSSAFVIDGMESWTTESTMSSI